MSVNTDANGESGGDTNKKVIFRLMIIVVAMFGFGFALVPIYDVFCKITGLNGKTGDQVTLSEKMEVDESREITVEFVANLNANMPWAFEPVTRSVRVHPGKPARIEYVARNLSNHAIIGNAVPSVAPGLAAPYFQKTECFCFTEQKLEAGEVKHMPVVFVVDPEMPEDVKILTLSYTFFVKPGSKVEPLAVNKIYNYKNQEI